MISLKLLWILRPKIIAVKSNQNFSRTNNTQRQDPHLKISKKPHIKE